MSVSQSLVTFFFFLSPPWPLEKFEASSIERVETNTAGRHVNHLSPTLTYLLGDAIFWVHDMWLNIVPESWDAPRTAIVKSTSLTFFFFVVFSFRARLSLSEIRPG